MRLLTLLLLPLTLGLAAAAATTKETKLQRITKLAVSSPGPIKLNDKTFDDITSGPRNYTSLVLLTALDPRFACHLCLQFQPDYELIARSWMKSRKDDEALFFSYLDFADGRATFNKLGLTSAPILYLYPATYGPNAIPGYDESSPPIQYDFPPIATQAEPLAEWISLQTPFKPRVYRPPNYTKIAIVAGSTTIILASSYFIIPLLLPALTHPTLWAAVSLISILLFTSGHMFNHIRGTAYMGSGPNGQLSYIAGGFSTQFAVESQIVGVVYAFLAFGTIALAMKIPRMQEPGRQQAAVVVWSVVILCLFSFLMGVFKVKNPAYPFWLPPLMGKI
ncbi:hypothetical protein DFH27DRAFT_511169 [Peziza echinospora]|nr:hypothetical protein DFH27DRAFT_511169 [Peziza echinospora]